MLNQKSYLHSVFAASIDHFEDEEYFLKPFSNYQKEVFFLDKFHNNHYRFSTSYNQKINAKHNFKIGLTGSHHAFDFLSQERLDEDQSFVTYLQNSGSSNQAQFYLQWKTRIRSDLTLTGGLHYNIFGLTGHTSLEPRFGAKWSYSSDQSIHLSLGIHSKPEHPAFYFVETSDLENKRITPNKNLDYLKAFHTVAGYDYRINKDFRIRAEVYYQKLFDVPVEDDPAENGSILNVLDIWDMLGTTKSSNQGKGRNYGIDITVEKNYSQNYYVLLTTSIFDSQFSTVDDRWFNTRFNSQYQVNLLAGKEIPFRKAPHKTIGFNGKAVLNGGDRTTPIDLERSRLQDKGVLLYDRFLDASIGTYYRFDVGINYKVNRAKTTHTIMLDIQNVTNHLNAGYRYYNRELRDLDTETHTGLFPVLNYRVEF
jgi:hypothetical protein